MKLSTKITKFQEGGAAPGGAPAQDPAMAGGQPQGAPAGGGDPAAGGGQDPVQQLVQMAQEALQSQNCESALAVCDGLLQMLSQGQEGGGSPAAEQGAPVYRAGGKMVRRV